MATEKLKDPPKDLPQADPPPEVKAEVKKKPEMPARFFTGGASAAEIAAWKAENWPGEKE